ncbi:MAG: A/G-specific adenine glycosylase [Prevotellaceae bacterium]|nr:A/G-specific adenine glycosylase [Prevotellaceae bacterium]
MQNRENNSTSGTLFEVKLLQWYTKNHRDLPWRETKDPYAVWLSEIILQQTQVAQGTAYYNRFIERFPTVAHLANAPVDDVLKLWQGLGYYSRARNLHLSAKQIMDTYHGVFPKTYQEILTLKGVGKYTAAAIGSFAYNLPYAAVDGNVLRFLARYYGIDTPIDSSQGKKEFADLADMLLDRQNAALHNQAMMEFGALQCVAARPKCEQCPFNTSCDAIATNRVTSLPCKMSKTAVTNRYLNYICVLHNGYTYLKKRSQKDIWQGLYEYPLIETAEACTFEQLLACEKFKLLTEEQSIRAFLQLPIHRHILSHQRLYATCIVIGIEQETPVLQQNYLRIPVADFDRFPIPRLIDIFHSKIVECQINI